MEQRDRAAAFAAPFVAMESSRTDAPQVTLEDLAALNREISALVRSGLPLEAGLRQVADDFGGGTGRLAARLAEDTAAGKSLAEAVAAQGDSLPRVYRAVVEAGLKSGRLSAALEGFAETAGRIADLRRIAGQAVVYPLVVMIIAWVMLLWVVAVLVPGYDWLEISDRLWIARLRMPQRVLWWLAAIVPAALVLLAAVWWRRSGRAGQRTAARSWTRWVPGVRRVTLLGGQANFADLLALLLSCRVPLPEALPLAAEASGADSLHAPAADLAAKIAAGQPMASRVEAARRLPPLVRMALLAQGTEESLLASLRRAAQIYRERAAGWIVDVAVMLPVAATVLLGVGVVGLYSALVLQPYIATLHEMSGWSWK